MSKEPLSYMLNIYLAIPRFLVSKIILHIFWDLESPMNSSFQISIHLSIICTTSSTQSYLPFLITPFPRFSHICSFQKKNKKKVTFPIAFIGNNSYDKFLCSFFQLTYFSRSWKNWLLKKKKFCSDFNDSLGNLVDINKNSS